MSETPPAGPARSLSRLEKLLFRLEAQVAVLAHVVAQIRKRDGVVFELGLGSGRTYDYLRTHLPDHEIFVFERVAECQPHLMPDAGHLILGDIEKTLPEQARRHEGRVVLAHSDVGSFEREHNEWMAGLVSRELPPALAPGALIVADLPLTIAGTTAFDLPAGAKAGRYFLYRYDG